MARGMNLFTACFLFILAASFPQSIKSQTSKSIANDYDYYSPWSPGDAGFMLTRITMSLIPVCQDFLKIVKRNPIEILACGNG